MESETDLSVCNDTLQSVQLDEPEMPSLDEYIQEKAPELLENNSTTHKRNEEAVNENKNIMGEQDT